MQLQQLSVLACKLLASPSLATANPSPNSTSALPCGSNDFPSSSVFPYSLAQKIWINIELEKKDLLQKRDRPVYNLTDKCLDHTLFVNDMLLQDSLCNKNTCMTKAKALSCEKVHESSSSPLKKKKQNHQTTKQAWKKVISTSSSTCEESISVCSHKPWRTASTCSVTTGNGKFTRVLKDNHAGRTSVTGYC